MAAAISETASLAPALRPAAAGESATGLSAAGLFARAMSFPVCVACALAVFVYLLIPQSVDDPDIWWHLRDAQWQLHAHAFLSRDLFSFTALGARWIDHEWLSELPFYFGWRFCGAGGLFAVTVAAIEAIFAGVFWLAYRKSGSTMAALAVSAVAALLSTISFGPRTLLFGWICLVAELLVVEHFRASGRGLYLLPPLFAVWVNTHGSWLIGMVVLAFFVGGGWFPVRIGAIRNLPWRPEQRRQLLIATALSVAALFANPYGWRLVRYPFDMAFLQKLNIATIAEWKTLDFHSPRGRIFFAALAALFLLQLLRRPKWTLYDLGLLALGVYSALTYSRFVFLAGILVLPLMAPLLAGSAPAARGGEAKAVAPKTARPRTDRPKTDRPKTDRPKTDRPWANAVLLLLLAFMVSRHIPSAAKLAASGEESFPIRAQAYLGHWRPQGNVFNDYLWGGFLIWNDPQVPVLIDSRVDIFEYNGVFQDYLDAIQLKNTLAILDKYHVRYVVFRRDQPLVYLLKHASGWKIDFEDATTTVLERS
jgi:hypothetical protein